MPRYVILDHDWPEPHYDLLLETTDHLSAWRVHGLPWGQEPVPAVPNFPHRKLYLHYEGELTGDRGRVARVDAGQFTYLIDTADVYVLELEGTKLHGRAELRRLGQDQWHWVYQPKDLGFASGQLNSG